MWIELKTEDDLPLDDYNHYHVETNSSVYVKEPYNRGLEEWWGRDENKKQWWLKNVKRYHHLIQPEE
jgi:hypothetical protein